MKILSILNVSNRENLGSDSGVIFHSIFFPECIKRGHEVVVAAPFGVNIRGINCIHHEPGKNKYDVRFRFEWDSIKHLIETTKPDIIFCHQIEQCSNIRALLVTLGLTDKVMLITYYHYIPILETQGKEIIWDSSLDHDGLAEVIFLRVLSALKTVDFFFVTSQYSRNLLENIACRYNFSYRKEKVIVMPPPVDPFFKNNNPVQFNRDRKVVLYSSRLYPQYGTDFLIDLLDHYRKSAVKFVITDFFSNKSNERKRLDQKTEEYRNFLSSHENVVVRTDGDNRVTYRDIITQASLVLGPYRKNANWSMSMLDAFMLGVPGISPNLASFPEFTPSKLIYNGKNDAIQLIDRLLYDATFWQESSNECLEIYEQFMPEKIVNIFFESLQK